MCLEHIHAADVGKIIGEEDAGGRIGESQQLPGGLGAPVRIVVDAFDDVFIGDFQPQLSFDGMKRTICDYIAGMTDNYAVDKYTELFIPMGWHIRG